MAHIKPLWPICGMVSKVLHSPGLKDAVLLIMLCNRNRLEAGSKTDGLPVDGMPQFILR
jgi:hypothetical protein